MGFIQIQEIGFLPNRKPRRSANWDKFSLLTCVMCKAQPERQGALEMTPLPETEIAAEEALLPSAAITVHDREPPDELFEHLDPRITAAHLAPALAITPIRIARVTVTLC